jgi:DNA recombination protein RmuC
MAAFIRQRASGVLQYDGRMEWILGVIGLAIGMALGAAAAVVRSISRRAAGQADLANARARADSLDQQVRLNLAEIERIRAESKDVESRREAAERRAAVAANELSTKQKQFDEQKRLLDDAEKRLSDAFGALGAKALRDNNEQFLMLASQKLAPFKELLDKIETKRLADQTNVNAHLEKIAAAHAALGRETGNLVTALRRPEGRGRWGELALRNTVEIAGMTEHCDFDLQVTIWNGDAAQRPDMVVNLPDRRVIPVDAKVAFDAYSKLLDCQDDQSRIEYRRQHADQVERHIKALANRRYWDGFSKECAPQLVVLFMPLESAYIAALEAKPELYERAMKDNVVIATPMILMALLRAIAYGWQQQALAANANEIKEVGIELYRRMCTFAAKLSTLGDRLSTTVKGYNEAAASFDARLLPGAKKLKDLQRVPGDDLDPPPMIEIEVRPVISPEITLFPSEIAAPIDQQPV